MSCTTSQTSAIAAGKKIKERVYILPNRRNVAGSHRLATLMACGVEVKQTDNAFKQCGKVIKPVAYFIDTAQPKGPLCYHHLY
jgi:hypothetical protein